MSLFEIINKDIIAAMKAKEQEKLLALRAVKAEFLLAKTAEGAPEVLPEETEIKIVQKMVKQRKDSALIYKEQGRDDLSQKELNEASIIEKYLPAQLNTDDLANILKAIIQKVGATSMKDFGKVMGTATKELAGKADNKAIAEQVKKLLPQ